MKFHKMEFPAVPKDQWYRYFTDLAHLEFCFTEGSALGHVRDQPFVFEMTDRETRHLSKALVYPPKAREWLKSYMRE